MALAAAPSHAVRLLNASRWVVRQEYTHGYHYQYDGQLKPVPAMARVLPSPVDHDLALFNARKYKLPETFIHDTIPGGAAIDIQYAQGMQVFGHIPVSKIDESVAGNVVQHPLIMPGEGLPQGEKVVMCQGLQFET